MRSGSQEHYCWLNKWLVLSCAFCNYVLINGVLYSFGILFVELLDTFKAGKSETAWIGSLQAGVYNLAGIIAGSMTRRFGIMKTIMAGTLLYSVGLISSSFSTSIYLMYFTFGFLPGLGFVMMGLPSVVAVNQKFDTQQSFAIGITQAGGSVGGFIFNPILQILIAKYGWKGALLLMSAIVLHGIVFSLLINALERKSVPTGKENEGQKNLEQVKAMLSHRRFSVDSTGSVKLIINSSMLKQVSVKETIVALDSISSKTKVIVPELTDVSKEENTILNDLDEIMQEEDLSYPTYGETLQKRKQNKCLSVVNKLVPYQVLKKRASFIFLLSALIRSFGFFTPFVLLPDLAVENNMTIEEAAWLASAMGISGATGRIFLGWIADFQFVDRLYLYIFCLLGGGVLTGVAPSFSLYELLMIYACIFGFAMDVKDGHRSVPGVWNNGYFPLSQRVKIVMSVGGECSLTPVICSDVAGRDKLAEMYGMLQTLCGIGVTCGTPFSGWLFEKTGGYRVSFILAGTFITTSGVMLLLLKCKALFKSQTNK